MKILHVCMSQFTDGWTYQENMLTKYHKNAGHEVSLLTSMYHYEEGKLVKDTKCDFIDENGVHIIRLEKKSEGLFHKLPLYKDFYESLLKEKPDVIFSHGCQYRDISMVIRYLKFRPQIKLYIDNHADFTNSATTFLSKNILHKIIWRYYANRALPYTEVFWGVLPARVDFLIEVYKLPKEKCKLLVMGADDEIVLKVKQNQSRKILRNKYSINEDDFVVVTGGKIDKAKIQTEQLIKAIKNISDSKVKLVIFGSIEEEIKERIIPLIDGVRIIYVGWIDPKDSYSYFEMADLVVFPGRHSVFWEQVAGQGIPMICKKWDGTTHIDYNGNVIFIDELNENELMNQIISISTNKEKLYKMKMFAENNSSNFLYSEIAKKSIDYVE